VILGCARVSTDAEDITSQLVQRQSFWFLCPPEGSRGNWPAVAEQQTPTPNLAAPFPKSRELPYSLRRMSPGRSIGRAGDKRA
jgi:hypothetical protein